MVPTDSEEYATLEARVGRHHLRRRLGIETEREARIFGQGLNFFHIENWYSIHGLMRGVLRLMGLYRRGRRNALRIELREHDIVLPHLPAEFDGFRILQLTDLHLDMNPEIPHAIIECIQEVDYDIGVLTGDFRAATFGPHEPCVDAMRLLRVHLQSPLYGILGNHDTIRMLPLLEALDIQMLINNAVPIERDGQSIFLAGIDDPHYYRADNLEKTCDDVPHDAVSILLSHSPEMYRHAAHAGFDVMLSGHTHGGQICLPGGTPVMCNIRGPRKLCAGRWQHGEMIGYTSRGTGVSIVDVRLNCPPEITLHRLRRA